MDMSQYIEMFLEESEENLQNLNEWILELEKNPTNNEIINSIFRAAHTLKGMAGSMGFQDMAELTHRMENVLEKFRSGDLKVTSDVITVLFRCLDILEVMVLNIKEETNEEVDLDNIISLIEGIENGEIAVTLATDEVHDDIDEKIGIDFNLNTYDKDIIKQAKEKSYNVFKLEVKLYKDCILKSARAFLVYKTLEDSGEIVKSIPSVEDLEMEKFEDSFILVFLTTKSSDEVAKMIQTISEIENVQVSEISLDESETLDANNYQNVKTDKLGNNQAAEETMSNKTEKEDKVKKVHQSVRVDLERMDKFMNLVGELVIHRTRLEDLSVNHKMTDLHETLEQVGRITTDLQDLVMKIRMLPIERVFNRFPRMVRDLSKEMNKDIELIIKGEETELDRTVIDEIGEPLVHLIRNSADHGIESAEERMKAGKDAKGTIRLSAYQEGNKAVIRIEDDGKGLDLNKIRNKAEKLGINTDGMQDSDIRNLIFMQGFSTSDKITDVSGRGVGMDVVKTKIGSLGGTIDILSEVGKGTAIIIKLPLTLSIIQALLVKVSEETYAISLGLIDRVININVKDIKYTNNKEVIVYRDSVIPLVRVTEKLGVKENDSEEKFIVIVNVGEKTIGLMVDSLIGQQEIVIKSIGKSLQNLKEYVGATILGDGLVTLILDVASLI